MNMKQWFGQATTGAGFATVLAGASALASGAMAWQQACPLLIGGIAGLLWPENKNLQNAASQAASDVASILSAYQAGGQPAAGTAATKPTISQGA